jgi:N-carbamoylputrescine amidase
MSPKDRSDRLGVGLVQMATAEEAEANDATAERGIREAAGQGARLICLPELYRGRYFCQSESEAPFALAEPVPGPTTGKLAALAKELDVCIVASLFERRAAGIYHNTAAVIEASGYLGKYRKMHIPDDPRYYEKYYFTPGDLGFISFDTSVGSLGTLICWDQWYPEAARITSLLGAQVLFYPTAIGWHPMEKAESGAAQVDAWRTAQRAHAIANGVYVAAPNRIGHEDEPGTDGITFFGRSFIADPFGRYLAEAGEAEEILIARCDPAVIETVRRHWPFLRDRRVDAYGPILSRYLGS